MDTFVQSCFFIVYTLRPIRPITMKIPLLKDTFMEMIEIHCDNILYPYVFTDSKSLVNVSPWEYR